MLFNSLRFLFFLAIVLAIYWRLDQRRQNALLLIASYVFYGAWNWHYLPLIWISTLVSYGAARLIERSNSLRARRHALAACLVVNFGILGVLKYYDFFAANLVVLLQTLGLPADYGTLSLLLPVGISFYTFQATSYVVDVYRGHATACRRLDDYALFIAFFPQLVAGPIERVANLMPQVQRKRMLTATDLTSGLWLLLLGYYLKIVAADNLAALANRLFAAASSDNAWNTLTGMYAFAFQIFGDFAGYSYIALGVSKLLGFNLMFNFRSPYLAASPREFWRHWHISLSEWLRDYVYKPLGGSRDTVWQTRRNLMLTMVVGGLWHGAAWTFVLWGAYHGLLLVAEHAWRARRSPAVSAAPMAGAAIMAALITFHLVGIGWIMFRATSVGQMNQMFLALVNGWSSPNAAQVADLLYVAFFALPVLALQAFQSRRQGDPNAPLQVGAPLRWAALTAMVFSLLALGQFGGEVFVYFQF